MLERIIVSNFSTNAYIYSIWKKQCLLIDPGGDSEKLIHHMGIKNMKPMAIICTHGHLDHVAAIGTLRSYYLEQGVELPVYIHEADKDYLGSDARQTHLKCFHNFGPQAIDMIDNLLHILPEPDGFLVEGEMLFDSDLRILSTPGHTPGSICLYSESQQLALTGDTLFFEGIGRTDLAGGNPETLKASIETKLMTLPPDTRIYPGHGPFSSIDREISSNPYL